MVLAAHAVFCLLGAAWRRRWWSLVRQLAVLALAAVFVNAVPAQGRWANEAQDLRKLGLAYQRQGRHELALEQFRRVVQANPGWLTARYNLGATLAQLGRTSEAIQQFRIALGLASNLGFGETPALVASVHHNLANALCQQGQHPEAVWHYRKAIELDPAGGEAVTYLRLGNTLATLGQHGEAVEALRQAIALDPDQRDAQYSLGWVLAGSGEVDDAAVHFHEVLRLDPQHAEAWRELGLVLVEQGRQAEAIEALQRSVQLQPENASAVEALGRALMKEARYAQAVEVLTGGLPLEDELLTNTLAWLLATCPDGKLRDGARAVRYALQVCPEVSECQPAYQDTLAAALAEAGRFNQAAETARQALQQARESGDDDLAQSIAARLRLYEAGKPYHQPRP
jgi:tetratricopeptide (TPR) repeat protein